MPVLGHHTNRKENKNGNYAKEKGLRRVYGDVLAENKTMLQMCAELGFRARDIGSDIRRVVLEIGNSGKQ
jgi:hypothetical protein